MSRLKKLSSAMAAAATALALTAPASPAIVGGTNAASGEFPSVAYVSFGGSFQCTGTLIAPKWVLTAGHCGSLTGAAVSTPAAWPTALISVYVNGLEPGKGTRLTVQRAVVHPNYLFSSGYDITLLQVSAPLGAVLSPTKVAGAAQRGLWDPGDPETIVGYGATEEGGVGADHLQKAQVPITTDSYCGAAYSDFDAATMVCAGFPEGGVDTCQGDSGGPMFSNSSPRYVVGATSFGEGCARPERPGVYARVADSTLREWIRTTTGGTGVA